MLGSIRSLAQLLTARALRKRNLPVSYLDPDEVAHEALLVFFRRCHTIQNVQSLRSWFWSIMSRQLSHLLAKAHPLVQLDDVNINTAACPAVPYAKSEDADECAFAPERQAVRRAVSELSPKLRQVVELRFFQGHTHEEAARVLGIKPAAARVRWIRAKRLLESRLSETLQIAT